MCSFVHIPGLRESTQVLDMFAERITMNLIEKHKKRRKRRGLGTHGLVGKDWFEVDLFWPYIRLPQHGIR
jgi:hypothetical protein